jgi:hypothetical protein
MFMTKFKDGSFTDFEQKILNGLPNNYDLKHLLVTGVVLPRRPEKLHTIRRSARMKKGTKLSLRVWTGLPYRSPQRMFVETECTGVQKIHIWQDSFGGRYVVVDDRDEILSDGMVERLALNDGFENVDQFFSWFGFEFTGYIIHWHDLKY